MKEEKALSKGGSAYLPTRFNPVCPVFPVIGLHPEFNSRMGLCYFERDRSLVSSQIVTGPEL